MSGVSPNHRDDIDAAAHTKSQVTSSVVAHAFLCNNAADTGFLLSDDDDILETGTIQARAGTAANFAYGNLISGCRLKPATLRASARDCGAKSLCRHSGPPDDYLISKWRSHLR